MNVNSQKSIIDKERELAKECQSIDETTRHLTTLSFLLPIGFYVPFSVDWTPV